MGKNLETVLSLVITLAAVGMAAAFISRQLTDDAAVPPEFNSLTRGRAIAEPQFYPEWRMWLARGVALDTDSAGVVIIEFSDLECPGCARFHEGVLRKIKATFGRAVTVRFIHFPLRIHRFAEISSVAAECAAEQGRFAEYVDVLFQKRDSLGLKSWGSYALEAGLPEQDRYQACVDDQKTLQRVRTGRSLADEIGLTGTPTVFVNGWRFPRTPTEDELSRVIQDILAGKEPFPSDLQ